MAWDWQFFCNSTITTEATASCFGKGGDITYLQWMLSAWGWTVGVAALALVIALLSGVAIGVLRTLSSRWRLIAMMWVELFRNIPLLLPVLICNNDDRAFIPQ
jgi:glutamate/aspartate transport system permease protein